MKTPPDRQKVNNPLEAMQDGEEVLCEVKRHPIGMVGMYLAAGLILVILALVAFVFVPAAAKNMTSTSINGYAAVAFIVLMIIIVGFVFISHYVYWGSRWILTSDSVTQILQHSLFNKEMAQLSLGNLEDVTAEQNGILAHMFNYGTIKVETAGEREKFVLSYCPNPKQYAQMVLHARENFEQNVREVGGASRSPYSTDAETSPAQPSIAVDSYQVPTDDDLKS